MRLLILWIMLSIPALNLFAQDQNTVAYDSIWCIQVLSTRNPHLLRPEMISAFEESAMVEESSGWYRILFIYSDREQAEIHLYSWQRQHKNAFIIPKHKAEAAKFYPLYTYD